jgi:TPR repeat protein
MMSIACNLLRYHAGFAILLLVGINVLGENASPIPAQKISQLIAGAERGLVQQEIELAHAYFNGDGVPQDAAEAARWYERAAEAGHTGAQNEIGYFYEAGIGVPVNMERSAHWFQRSAASGSAQGSLNLGVAYLFGRGVPKDNAMGATFITEAYHRGSGFAASYLGDMYYFGIGVPQNRAAAERWYQAGLKRHDAMAAYRLGSLYSVADGHVHDYRKAAGLLRTSAEGGYVLAMHSLGFLLINYPKLEKSPHEAQPWLEKAANAGNWRSSIILGILSRDGKGISADNKAAYFHFLVAARQGGPQAQAIVANDLKIVGGKLSADDQAALASTADAWFAQHSQTLLYINRREKDRSSFHSSAVAAASPDSFVGQLAPSASHSGLKVCEDCVR